MSQEKCAVKRCDGSGNNIPSSQSLGMSSETSVAVPPSALSLNVPSSQSLGMSSGTSVEVASSALSLNVKRRNVLMSVGATRALKPTPKARIPRKEVAKLLRQISEDVKDPLNYFNGLEEAEVYMNSQVFHQIAKDKTASVNFFTKLQIQQSDEKGIRFSNKDKILSLLLFKEGPKAYRLLSKIFALPAAELLLDVLRGVSLKTGIDERMFSHLKKAVHKKPTKDRYCTLIFDEMNLSPRLQYDERKDRIEGFEDFGNERRSANIADRVLVFMIRGIRRKFKQPVAYVFCEGPVKTAELVLQLRTVIRAVSSTGLKVVATVCDQGKSNQSAIEQLVQDTKRAYILKIKDWDDDKYFFEVDGRKVIPLFDVPHLLKGIRNNMISKDISCEIGGKQLVGKWEHILQAYRYDAEREIRLIHKITDSHVIPEKIFRMKVEQASHVFSYQVAAAMMFLANSKIISSDASQTALVLLFFDQLFDSVNCNSAIVNDIKPLQGALTKRSAHLEFWSDAISTLKSVEFIDGNGVSSKPRTLENWIKTIRGFRDLWMDLKGRGFNSLPLRRINQDPLENFFASIRSRGSRNVMPTCMNFEAAYKALLLNNLVSPHPVRSNCEDDKSGKCLQSIINMS